MPLTTAQPRMKLSIQLEHIKSVTLEKPAEGLELAGYLGQFAMDEQNNWRKVTVALVLQAQLLRRLSEVSEPDEPFSFAIDYGTDVAAMDRYFVSNVFMGAIRNASARGEDVEVERRYTSG